MLPNEPRVLDRPAQEALTARHLLPALKDLEALFLSVRLSIDGPVREAQPHKTGKPYPLGQCLEISLAVKSALEQLDGTELDQCAARGQAALDAFLKAGGVFRQVWGDLRGEYFQNAFQLGALYLDVANDTVVPTKPKVEILPFEEARLFPIEDFGHFRRIAARYWGDETVPNHVLPELAPYCPLIHLRPGGEIRIGSGGGYMAALTEARGFAPSEAVLDEPAMPQAVFDRLAAALTAMGFSPPPTPEAGREEALRRCRTLRALREASPGARSSDAQFAAREINRELTGAGDAAAWPEPRYVPVSRARHAGRRWRRADPASGSFAFASREVLAPLTLGELGEAARALPIAFVPQGEGFVPAAVVGLDQGRNLLVGPDGRWRGDYAPAAWRAYPFALARAEDGRQILCVDEAALAEDGQPFFDDAGAPTEAVAGALRSLAELEAGHAAAAAASAELQRRGLIAPWTIRIEPRSGTRMVQGPHCIAGLHCIDPAAFEALPAAAVEELRRTGALAVAESQRLSVGRLQALTALPGALASNVRQSIANLYGDNWPSEVYDGPSSSRGDGDVHGDGKAGYEARDRQGTPGPLPELR